MKIVIASKLALIALLVYFFLDPQVFLTNGFGLGVNGAVVCRGLALVFAVKMTYDLVEDIYNEYH